MFLLAWVVVCLNEKLLIRAVFFLGRIDLQRTESVCRERWAALAAVGSRVEPWLLLLLLLLLSWLGGLCSERVDVRMQDGRKRE